jgi:hypothetical protein
MKTSCTDETAEVPESRSQSRRHVVVVIKADSRVVIIGDSNFRPKDVLPILR